LWGTDFRICIQFFQLFFVEIIQLAGYAAQKIQVAPLEDFLCCADFESLRDGGTPTAADAASRYDLSRENAMPGGPQTARHCSIINNSSADDTQSKAARILNRHAVVRLPAVPCPQTSAPQ
jgi:hypothetical protein